MSIDYHELGEQLERVYSRRLALRPVSLCDAWPLFHATRNPLFNRHLLWAQPTHEQEVLDRIDAIMDASRRGRLTALSAVVRETGEWTSLFRFLPNANDTDAVEMGVWTHDRFWHGRFGLELGRLCVDAAFGMSRVSRLVGAASADNRASCHLMKAVGMSPAKVVVRRTEYGAPVQLQEFELTRLDWEASRKGETSFSTHPRAHRSHPIASLRSRPAVTPLITLPALMPQVLQDHRVTLPA